MDATSALAAAPGDEPGTRGGFVRVLTNRDLERELPDERARARGFAVRRRAGEARPLERALAVRGPPGQAQQRPPVRGATFGESSSGFSASFGDVTAERFTTSRLSSRVFATIARTPASPSIGSYSRASRRSAALRALGASARRWKKRAYVSVSVAGRRWRA